MNLEILENYLSNHNEQVFIINSLIALTQQYGYTKSFTDNLGYIFMNRNSNIFDHTKMLVKNNIPFVISHVEAIYDLKFVNNNLSIIPYTSNDDTAIILLTEFNKSEMQQRIKEEQLMGLI